LKFLKKADRQAIRAAGNLEKVLGVPNPEARTTYQTTYFSREWNSLHRSQTDGQYTYLHNNTASKKAFADAMLVSS